MAYCVDIYNFPDPLSMSISGKEITEPRERREPQERDLPPGR